MKKQEETNVTNLVKFKPSEMIEYLQFCLKNNLSPLIKGKPGIGKSSLVYDAAKKLGWKVIVTYPAVSDPTDYKGLPYAQDGIAKFLPYPQLKELIETKEPLVFFMDDIGQASEAVQKALMSLLLDRKVGDHDISPEVRFIAATNRREDRAGVSGILEPVKSRFAGIVELETDVDEWRMWAIKEGLPEELISFVGWKRTLFAEAKPSKDIVNTVSPRTLAFVGKIQKQGIPAPLAQVAYAAAAGEAFSIEYTAYLKMLPQLPDLDLVIKDPENAPVPKEVSVQYTVAFALARKMTPQNMGAIMYYLGRLPMEIQTVCMKEVKQLCIMNNNHTLTQTPQFTDWIFKNADMLDVLVK